jgi:formylmethanofuran dehydrogenase subunit B
MNEVRINGKPALLAAAAEHAAEILSAARMPVIAGLGTDVAGARASILLAERLRGA